MNHKNQISDRVKILLIDEDESIFYLIRRVLQRENYRLYTSTSGRSGMEMSTSICPDLILMDTQLSDMDGIGSDPVVQRVDGLSDSRCIRTDGIYG